MISEIFIAPGILRHATTTTTGWACLRARRALNCRHRARGPRVDMAARALARAAATRGAL